jgi:antitoxin VapB
VALSIKNVETDRLARELAAATGETITAAVTEAIRIRLDATRRTQHGLARRLLDISESASRLSRLDDRTDDEILGYDERGLTG